MKKTTLFIAAVLLAAWVSGCAFGTRHLKLGYEAGTISEPRNNVMLYVKPFKDDRVDKRIVGRVRNGYGMKCAKIVTDTNISNWVTSAIKTELNNLGYTVTNYDTKNRVEGSVIEVNVTSMMMYEGKVILEVILLRDNKELFSRKYQGADQAMNWASRAKSYGKILEKSLQDAVVEASYDIDRKISKEILSDEEQEEVLSDELQQEILPDEMEREALLDEMQEEVLLDKSREDVSLDEPQKDEMEEEVLLDEMQVE